MNPLLKDVFKEVKDAIKSLEQRGAVEVLQKCPDTESLYLKLMEFLPETINWSPMPARQLVVYLERKYNLKFGVCPYYQIEGNQQYCTHGGGKIKCLCAVPQPQCDFLEEDLMKLFLFPAIGVAY